MSTAASTSELVPTRTTDEPVFFPASDKTYFGIVSTPHPQQTKTTGVVLLSGTYGGTTTVGRNRMWVKMARQLAEHGYPVLRFDYAGLGDSSGEMVCYELETPAVPELNAAFGLLASRGVTEFIVVGTCYGSRSALVGSAGNPRVIGVHLLVPPVRSGTKGSGGADHLAETHGGGALAKKALQPRTIKRLAMSSRTRSSALHVAKKKARSITKRGRKVDTSDTDQVKEAGDDFRRAIHRLLSDGVPIHFLYGEDDFFLSQFQEAASRKLGRDLDRFPDLVEVETVPGIVRGFLSARVQNLAINSVVEWVEKRTS